MGWGTACRGGMCNGAPRREEACMMYLDELGTTAASRNCTREGSFTAVIHGEEGMASIGPAGMTTDDDDVAVAAAPPKKDPNAVTAWREAASAMPLWFDCWWRAEETAEWRTRSRAVPAALQSAMV